MNRKNPLKLNPLQLRTLALFQFLATLPERSTPVPDNGGVFLSPLPQPHGDHFHVGHKVALTRDASGLTNQSVWLALERKGLIKSGFPYALTVTPDGLAYDCDNALPLYGSDH